MNKKYIGIGLQLIGLVILGFGIGKGMNNPDVEMVQFIVPGLVLSSIGLLIAGTAKKKQDK